MLIMTEGENLRVKSSSRVLGAHSYFRLGDYPNFEIHSGFLINKANGPLRYQKTRIVSSLDLERGKVSAGALKGAPLSASKGAIISFLKVSLHFGPFWSLVL